MHTITSQGIYFQCNGEASCQRVFCDLCQQIRVREFENRPQLMIHKLSLERELHRVYGSLSTQTEENKGKDPFPVMCLLTREE